MEDSPARVILRDLSPVSASEKRFARFHVRRPQ
jgi:hypothetical protein